ncbi:MAG: hypothetical protein QOH21_3286, partial [Acidobacteriota bacterium]|nr:hypothetical protein [Acidobacteriota bacterium]
MEGEPRLNIEARLYSRLRYNYAIPNLSRMAFQHLRSKLAFLRPKRPTGGIHVFISYTGRHPGDEKLAQDICRFLGTHDVKVFVAPLSIDPGADWRATLRQTIERCSHFVIIVSEASMNSTQVAQEIRQASDRFIERGDMRIVPILYGRPSNNPFSALQAISYRNYSSFAPIDYDGGGDFQILSRRLLQSLGLPSHLGGPKVFGGSITPLLCNREFQEDTVDAVLGGDSSPGAAPAAFFLGGREEDNPDSFVRRIVETKLVPYAGNSRPARIDIPWHGGWTLTSGPPALRNLLFRAFTFPLADPSPEAFRKHVAALADPVVVVNHALQADEWSADHSPQVISAYLDFWDVVSDLEKKPLFILFFQILYASEDGDSPAPSPSAIRRALSDAVSAGKRRMRVTLLRDLTCVKDKHVTRWFETYAGYVLPREREARIAVMFADSQCQ